MKTVIEMARESGIRDCTCNGTLGCLERFVALVRADEREQRTWVGLTDEAIWLEYQRFWPFHPAEEPTLAKDIAKFANAIEAKLKEKNT